MGHHLPIKTDLENWSYSDHFAPSRLTHLHPVVEAVEERVKAAGLENHPFLVQCLTSRKALHLWAAQEIVITNAFSQVVLAAASAEPNVHIRAILTEIASGEHGRCRKGVAKKSHPWLLDGLRASIDMPTTAVSPHPATVAFVGRLEESMARGTLAAIAWIGVGNERLIEPEYVTVRRGFEELHPLADFGPFLDANINEDYAHSRMCYEAASMLITDDAQAGCFFEEAAASIASRVQYFDDLLASSVDGP